MARILIVDDSEQNLLLYQLYLKGAEFEVVAVGSGREALEAVDQEEFDLVLLDVVMPEMNGIEVCRRLKATPRTASIPVIFFTGRMRDESDKQVAYEVGAVDYLTKPVEKAELIARIRVMLRLREERFELESQNASLADTVRKSKDMLAALAEQLNDYQRLAELSRQGAAHSLLVSAAGIVLDAAPALMARFEDLSVGGDLSRQPPEPWVKLWPALKAAADRAEAGFRSAELVPGYQVQGSRMEQSGQWILGFIDDQEQQQVLEQLHKRMPVDLGAEIQALREGGKGNYRISNFVGQSPVLQDLTEQVDKLRQTRSTVLIHGASGSGKELIASALHYDGPYGTRPFTPIHCGAISPELIESELFGYEKGAFTGAANRKDGLFAASDGGTMFLDEIAETSLDLQVKLLRVLQLGEVRPVGATRPRHVDVRIIAATNRDLLEMVAEGTFREDLYYRLNVVTLEIPALRDRRQDIPLLVQHFLDRFNEIYGRLDNPVREVSRGAMDLLSSYDWPGNVRQLENTIDRAFALGVGSMLDETDLPANLRSPQPRDGVAPQNRPRLLLPALAPAREPAVSERNWLDHTEQAKLKVLLETLIACDGDRALARERLGIPKSSFYRYLKRHHLTRMSLDQLRLAQGQLAEA